MQEPPENGDGNWQGRSLHRYEVVGQRYTVVRFLGTGGMGEVYEVEDLDVPGRFALKIIKPSIARNLQVVLRFRKEIQLARQVNHPNVCRIYHFDYYQSPEAPQKPIFLIMELLRGKTLAERIREGGYLTTTEALPFIKEICAGLSAIHNVGVVHRDLKPGNVFLAVKPDGIQAVVTDFGVAVPAAETVPGALANSEPVAGTPAYIAPEQRNGGEVTPTADVYSLGVLILQTVTGVLPPASSEASENGARHQAPTAPQKNVADLDPRWKAVIERCLEAEPEKRFPNAKAVAEALTKSKTKPQGLLLWMVLAALLLLAVGMLAWRPWSLRSQPAEKHIAIIPFTAIDPDSETQVFADGLTATLAAKLSQLTLRHSLQLVPITELRAQHVTSVEDARKGFGIDLAITGSVHRSGRMVRVSFVLVDARSRIQLASDTVDFSRTEPFALEDRVVSNVVVMLGIKPTTAEQGTLISHGTAFPRAFDYYLLGRGYLLDYERAESVESAITVLTHSLQFDKHYADAQAALGEAYWYKYELSRDARWVEKAITACRRSAELQPGSSSAHACLGNIYKGTGRLQAALEEFKRAMTLDPSDDNTYRGLATTYQELGRGVDAENTFKQAINLRPRYWGGYSRLGAFYYSQARYDEAVTMFQQVIALAPDNSRGYSNLGGTYLAKGHYNDAIPVLRRAAALQQSPAAYSNLATCYFHLRRFEDAVIFYERAVKLNDQDYLMWGNLADAQYRIANRQADALDSYNRAIALAEREMLVNPNDAGLLGNLADYYSMTGEKAHALSYLERAFDQSPHDALLALKAAEVHNQLGETDKAFEWLREAVTRGYSLSLLRDTPVLDNLRSDERFQELFRTK